VPSSSTALRWLCERLQEEDFQHGKGTRYFNFLQPARSYVSPFIDGDKGSFTLKSDGMPYYIKGIAFNTEHDWRDGFMPLTRRQLEKDFRQIREMGANTIRRYNPGIYDRNILNIASEYQLKVMYGFWFDPAVDFFSDTTRVREYISEVEETVQRYKDHRSVLCWSIGNETWGLLKHRYAKPYLVKVRNAYVKMVEHLAQRIHSIDPTRPVVTCIEHEEYQIAGELTAFRDGAPSVDLMGVNSYYQEQISRLNHIAWQFDSLRPYIISEFGPRGYWDPKYNRTKGAQVLEDADVEKAAWYKYQWENYVQAYGGYNLGGFAYCWHDRMEGSFTWFGITDYRGRLKPSYFALKEAWTGALTSSKHISVRLSAYNKDDRQILRANVSGLNTYKLEWRLFRNDYLYLIDDIVQTSENEVSIPMPKGRESYRAYVFAAGPDNEQVVTASVPVKR
jgi:cellulose synthase (UDP-forming)